MTVTLICNGCHKIEYCSLKHAIDADLRSITHCIALPVNRLPHAYEE